jgi:6-phosphogluconolactonase
MIEEFLFNDRAQLFAALEADCLKALKNALVDKGIASLLVSGGSTPEPLYAALSASNMDWKNVRIALIDERWVECDHEASNEAFIRRTLLTNQAEKAPFTGMKNHAPSAAEGCEVTEARYQALPQPFTVAILGMGVDGHTASLYPHAEGLAAALIPEGEQLVAPISARPSQVTGPYTERLTLTVAGLLRSERLNLILTGEEKLAVYRAARTGDRVEDMPVRSLLQQEQVPVALYWAP